MRDAYPAWIPTVEPFSKKRCSPLWRKLLIMGTQCIAYRYTAQRRSCLLEASGLVVRAWRIYALRNQLMYGAATCSSSVNREQVRNCTNLLAKRVPLVIESMLD